MVVGEENSLVENCNPSVSLTHTAYYALTRTHTRTATKCVCKQNNNNCSNYGNNCNGRHRVW